MPTTAAQLFEATMLICFGISWPVDILNTLRVRRGSGKSLTFMVLILGGYLAGIAAKIIRAGGTGGTFEMVTWFYVANMILVSADIALTRYYRRQDS